MSCTASERSSLSAAKLAALIFNASCNRSIWEIDFRFRGGELRNLCCAEDKRSFSEAMRRDTSLKGYPRFTIKPPGERSEYHVLVYVERWPATSLRSA